MTWKKLSTSGKEEPMKIVPVEEIPLAEDIKDVPERSKVSMSREISRNILLKTYRQCKEMEKVCEEADGIGLSAVQVGIPAKFFIIKTNGEYEHFVNCEYEPVGDDKIVSVEGCLSLLNEEGNFRRFEMIRSLIVKVTGKKLVRRENVPLTLEDFSAYIHAEDQGVVFQHEIDHQQGPEGLISAKGKEVFIW